MMYEVYRLINICVYDVQREGFLQDVTAADNLTGQRWKAVCLDPGRESALSGPEWNAGTWKRRQREQWHISECVLQTAPLAYKLPSLALYLWL